MVDIQTFEVRLKQFPIVVRNLSVKLIEKDVLLLRWATISFSIRILCHWITWLVGWLVGWLVYYTIGY